MALQVPVRPGIARGIGRHGDVVPTGEQLEPARHEAELAAVGQLEVDLGHRHASQRTRLTVGGKVPHPHHAWHQSPVGKDAPKRESRDRLNGQQRHVSDQTFDPAAIAGRQVDRLVDAETAVRPGTHVLDHFRLDLLLGQVNQAFQNNGAARTRSPIPAAALNLLRAAISWRPPKSGCPSLKNPRKTVPKTRYGWLLKRRHAKKSDKSASNRSTHCSTGHWCVGTTTSACGGAS